MYRKKNVKFAVAQTQMTKISDNTLYLIGKKKNVNTATKYVPQSFSD